MDTQGAAFLLMLTRLGCPASRISVGKHIEIEMDAPSLDATRAIVAGMRVKFLTNPAIEEFSYLGCGEKAGRHFGDPGGAPSNALTRALKAA